MVAPLLPPCLLCGDRMAGQTPFSQLCGPCQSDLPWYRSPCCPQCALPTLHGEICGQCLQHTPAVDRCFAAMRYGYPLDRLLQRYKYQQDLACGHSLRQAMLLTWPQVPAPADILIAMPMHPQRLALRGFNHAQDLAIALAQRWRIDCLTSAVIRIRDTAPQAGMDIQSRQRSLRGAFRATQSFAGRRVMLIDDVMTTGASMHALAKTIKQAGATQVTAAVLARTLVNAGVD